MLKVFCSPSRYTQGPHAPEQLGSEMRNLGLDGPALLIAGSTAIRLLAPVWATTFAGAAIRYRTLPFSGECTAAEIRRGVQAARDAGARVVIGALILGAVAVLGKGLQLPPRPSRAVTLGAGLIAGVTNGLAGMAGPAVVTYLLALPLTTAVVRATAIVFFVITAISALIPMAWHGLVGRAILGWSLAALPALVVGARLGRFGFQHSPAHWHRRVALVVLSLLGTGLILRGALGR